MKKVFTLFCLIAFLCVGYAQSSYRALTGPKSFPKSAPAFTKSFQHNGNRAATSSFAIDYDGNDEAYATLMGFDYRRFVWEVNKNYGNTTFSLDYAAVYFDTIQFLDPNDVLTFVPRASTTLTLDSFLVYFVHTNTTGTFDSITFTVFNSAAAVVTGYGTPTATLTTPSLWDTTIVVNTSIPLTTTNFTIASFAPNLAFAQGQTFGIRVDFEGDTANKFEILAGYRDECADACYSEITVAGNNTGYYLNLTQGANNFSGYYENDGQGAIFYDCDQSGGYTDGGCENFPIQNVIIVPFVTADVEYGVAITADSLRGCPGAVLNLAANGFGTSATPLTYNWATTSGQLSTTTDQNVSLIIAGNATVSVTVTDANGDTTVTSVPVTSRGIGVNITNPNPVNLTCGSTATISSTLTGIQTGKNYTWSTGATGTNTFSITVNAPGAYSVTVSNNSGCSASASVNVVYPNVSNTVSFSPPASPLCRNAALTFTNTSTQQSNGWTGLWEMGNGDLVTTTPTATYTYATAGSYAVKLTMDSAGCKFTYTRNITVVVCSGIEDFGFSNDVTLQPNPSNGNIMLTVNGAEKNISVKVYSVIGSEVKAFSANDVPATFTRSFDFSDLSNGTYLVKIQSADKIAVKRLTINK